MLYLDKKRPASVWSRYILRFQTHSADMSNWSTISTITLLFGLSNPFCTKASTTTVRFRPWHSPKSAAMTGLLCSVHPGWTTAIHCNSAFRLHMNLLTHFFERSEERRVGEE